MYFFPILFFISLTAIILMIGRKLLLANNVVGTEERANGEILLPPILDSDKIKDLTIKNSKRVAHTLVWVVLRTYLISVNFLNKKAKEWIQKIKSRINKNHNNESLEKKEVSKYIKVISEYRQKIRRIKHRIKEEEGIE